MPNSSHVSLTGKRILRGIVYLILASTTLVIAINANDSSVTKTPLLVLLCSLLAIAFLARAIWMRKLEFYRTPADIVVFVMFLLILVSLTYTQNPRSSLQALAVWISFIICFFAGTQLFVTQADLTRLILIISAIASLVCVVGLLQYFFADRLFLEFFIGTERRVTSTLTNAIYLSGYIVLLFPILLSFVVARKRTPGERWMLGLLLCALAFLLIATATRSSIVAFVVSIAAFVPLSKRVKETRLWGITGVIVALGVAIYLSPTLMKRIDNSFSQDSSSSFARRLYFWQAGYNAFKAAPFFGHGIGSFEHVVLDYRSPEYWVAKSEDVVPHAHNELIETAVDLGGAGVITYLAILATVAVAGMKVRPKENAQDRLLAVGLLCSIFAILIDNLANMSLRVVPVGATAWLLMGILASQPYRKEPDLSVDIRVPKAVAFLLLCSWIAFAAWYGNLQLGIYRSEGHLISGILEEQKGDLPASITEFRSAVDQNPDNLLARSNLTLALLRMHRADQALQASEQLQTLSPRYPKLNLMQAAAFITLKRYNEAVQAIDRELALRNHPDAYYYQAVAFRSLSDTVGELSALEGLLRACIKGQLQYEFGPVAARVQQLVRKETDIRQLKDIFEHLLLLFPSNQAIAGTLAEFHRRLGEPGKAEQLLRQFPQGPGGR